ncbi:DUF2637 domain-containing protein [Streptomyces sp. Edi2]|uniref:DUF2637 domain-containing protein n=1 Tax=Streptomyces sp. Edi2 TaxID=3162528 RepID=UPI003306376A
MVPTYNRSVRLTRTQRALIAVVVLGAIIIAAIGFSGSYAAVRDLAERKGFGSFSAYFPIGVDAGIASLLALDLLLTWLRIPLPLLRQAAWLLTVATIGFNAAAASDVIGVAMHSTIPLLFVVSVEAARHAVGRLGAITADQHMDGVRAVRWVLSPLPTFLLWRKMRLWELRRYSTVIRDEQDRLVHQAKLRSQYGRQWRRRAPIDQMLPLRLARFGVPLRPGSPAAGAPGPTEVLPSGSEDHAEEPAGAAAEPRAALTRGNPRSGAAAEAAADEQRRHREQHKDDENSARETTVQGTPRAAPRPAVDDSAATPPGKTQQKNDPHVAEELAADSQAHRDAVAKARTNADAIRYALGANAGADDSAIVTWLARFGRTVNRGQVYKVRQQAEKKRLQLAVADSHE